MDRNDRIEDELFPFYALDALTDDERAEVDAYVVANPAARARLSALLADVAVLAELSAPLAPAPEVKTRLMARVAADMPPAPALQTEVDQLRSFNTILLDELAVRDETLAYLAQPGAVTFALSDPSGERPTAAGTVTTAADGAVTLAVMNLPPPESGQTYQAWLIVGQTPISAGTFAVDPSGRALYTIANPPAGAFDAFGVSLEPAGGSQQPTEIVLLGAEA